MKKLIFAMIALLLVAISCNKDEPAQPIQTVTVSFKQNLVSSNLMTRGEGNEILDIINEQTSTYINITLKNTDLGKKYTCRSNESITIPVGNYEISGEYITVGKDVVGTSGKIYETPVIKCDTFNAFITNETQKITLNSYYNCYAVFALIDECKTCYASYCDNNVIFYKKGKYYVGYFKYDGMKINIVPYDDSTEFISTEYIFSTTYEIGKIYAEYGKYYVIHPQKVNKINSSFELTIPGMIEGKI